MTMEAGRGETKHVERDKPKIPELQPCRYCGGKAEIVKKRFTYFDFAQRPLILCRECGLTTREFETVEEAVSYWNNRKELFNMTENKHGITPKTEFTMGGIAWTVIQTGESWVKCIASECVEERAFDEGNKNDFAASSLRAYLNGEFLQRLIDAGAPEAMFKEFVSDLAADDGLKQYGTDSARIGLITCDEYRALRENIPPLPDSWWWTATPDSPINHFVRRVSTDGTLDYYNAYGGNSGVRPLCVLQSEILKSYIDGGAKQRAEAVDMMKHIAAAWNVKPEEVFGKDGAGNDNV